MAKPRWDICRTSKSTVLRGVDAVTGEGDFPWLRRVWVALGKETVQERNDWHLYRHHVTTDDQLINIMINSYWEGGRRKPTRMCVKENTFITFQNRYMFWKQSKATFPKRVRWGSDRFRRKGFRVSEPSKQSRFAFLWVWIHFSFTCATEIIC